jgi:lysophospholipid acyltransferase (LPLAT)-like uncharacterized protein
MKWLLGGLARLVFSTWRLRARLPDGSVIPPKEYSFGPEIFALCERDAFALSGVIVDRSFTVLVSFGRDGDLASQALEGIGCRVVRGARRRGGLRALRELMRELDRSDAPMAIVVDGPLGPANRPKPGIFLCARESGRPIVPLGAAAKPSVEFRKSWSKLYLPLPGSRVSVIRGESLPVDPNATAEDFDRLSDELHDRLVRAHREARDWNDEGLRDGVAPAQASVARGTRGR